MLTFDIEVRQALKLLNKERRNAYLCSLCFPRGKGEHERYNIGTQILCIVKTLTEERERDNLLGYKTGPAHIKQILISCAHFV